ncbi:MAG: hypothetical protein HYX68_28950 [Planctomycetes bacterium]|nr:hypothetical protein [Planctomycetota bacterium]
MQRRFEILLPLRFNDGTQIPDELRVQTVLDLRKQFGALSTETQIIRGVWEHAGQSYRDEMSRLYIDVADTPENQKFFHDYKELLKTRFQQLDIRITTYIVEVY